MELAGKVSRVEPLKYLPSGVPVCTFTLAASQKYMGKASVGYFEMLLTGEEAEFISPKLKVGKRGKITGQLWTRQYRDRQQRLVRETLVLVKTFEEQSS